MGRPAGSGRQRRQRSGRKASGHVLQEGRLDGRIETVNVDGTEVEIGSYSQVNIQSTCS